MAVQQIVTPWDQQPQELLEVDWSHPIAADLALLLPLRGRYDATDLVSERPLTFGAATGDAIADFGRAASFGSSTTFVDFPQPEGLSGTTPITFLWVAEGRASTGYSTILTWRPTGATNPFLIYRSASDSNYQLVVGPRSNSGTLPNFAAGLQANNTPEVFVLVCQSGTQSTSAASYKLFRNGRPVAQAGITSFGVSTASVARVGCLDSGADPFEGLLSNVGIVRRALTDGEAESLSANPWQLFQRREFVPFGFSAGGVTLTVADALQAQLTDNVVLPSAISLTAADAIQTQLADAITLSTLNDVSLTVNPAAHAQLADAPTLTTAQTLAVADALHVQLADQLSLSITNDIALAVNAATHAQLAGGLALSTADWLAVADALHTQLADIVGLTGGIVVAQDGITIYLRRRRR